MEEQSCMKEEEDRQHFLEETAGMEIHSLHSAEVRWMVYLISTFSPVTRSEALRSVMVMERGRGKVQRDEAESAHQWTAVCGAVVVD